MLLQAKRVEWRYWLPSVILTLRPVSTLQFLNRFEKLTLQLTLKRLLLIRLV